MEVYACQWFHQGHLYTGVRTAASSSHRPPVRTEVASKYGDAWIENKLREANRDANPLLSRVAFKMATAAGWERGLYAFLGAWP